MAGQLKEKVVEVLDALDGSSLSVEYQEQNEFFFLESFLSPGDVESLLIPAVEGLKEFVNRSLIPKHKKSGSVSFYDISKHGPVFLELYESPVFINFLSQLVGAEIQVCPPTDPHSCALYCYTRAGDHIGYHYDTSYYRGARYTVLLGLIENSSSMLECQLYRDDPERETQELSISVKPGTLVVFNGDKLYHRVTPLGEAEERIILTMEYVTDPSMGVFKRAFSNLKDAFAYFGVATLFRKR